MFQKSILAAVLFGASLAVSAQSVTVTGGAPVTSIGDLINSGYDTFQFNSGAFVAQVGAVDITSYDFGVGGNCTDRNIRTNLEREATPVRAGCALTSD